MAAYDYLCDCLCACFCVLANAGHLTGAQGGLCETICLLFTVFDGASYWSIAKNLFRLSLGKTR